MAVQHLAAIKIQSAIQRFLFRKRHQQGRGNMLTGVYANWQEKRLLQDKKNLQIQIYNMAIQMHAANMKGSAKFNNKNITQKKWDYRDELKY
jgi:hypothetical protein